MTTPNLDALAKLAPFTAVSTPDADWIASDDGEAVEFADVAAIANEWAELRAYRDRTIWHPIDTAPKDGTEILALCRAPARDGAYYEAVRYLTDAPCWVTREGWMRHPTHWMPLPAEPGQGATDGK